MAHSFPFVLLLLLYISTWLQISKALPRVTSLHWIFDSTRTADGLAFYFTLFFHLLRSLEQFPHQIHLLISLYTIDAKTPTPDSQVPEFQSTHFMQCRLRTNELRRMNEEIEVGLNFGLIFFD